MNAAARGTALAAGAAAALAAGVPAPHVAPALLTASAQPARLQAGEIVIVATQQTLRVSGSVGAGPTTLRLINRGREVHQAQLALIRGEHTPAEAVSVLSSGRAVDWLTPAGGPGPVAPGESARLTQRLEAGRYLVYSPLPSRQGEGRAQLEVGMAADFTVGPGSPAADSTNANAVLLASDRGFHFQRTLLIGRERVPIEAAHLAYPMPAGETVFRIENQGPSPHEIRLLRSDPHQTIRGFEDWLARGQSGASPGHPLAGVSALPAAGRARLHVHLTPGNYWLYCPIRHRRFTRGFETGELAQILVR